LYLTLVVVFRREVLAVEALELLYRFSSSRLLVSTRELKT